MLRRRSRDVVPLILFTLSLSASVAGCGVGPEAGVWCRDMPDNGPVAPRFKLLILDGESKYWVFDGLTPTVWGNDYEMAEEDGDWYWHSWIGEREYANRVERLVEGEQLVLFDKDNQRLSYYYFYREFSGMPEYQIQAVDKYAISEELRCEPR